MSHARPSSAAADPPKQSRIARSGLRIFGGYCPSYPTMARSLGNRQAMPKWLTRKRVIWLSITAVVAFLLVDGFGTKPAHEVHTPGATPLKAAVVSTDIPYYYKTVPASQSISELRCQVWVGLHRD